MFNKATNGYNFFLMDLKTQEPQQYRENFDEVLDKLIPNPPCFPAFFHASRIIVLPFAPI